MPEEGSEPPPPKKREKASTQACLTQVRLQNDTLTTGLHFKVISD